MPKKLNVPAYYKAVGARLRARRAAKGLALEAVAPHMGCTWQQWQKYEAGANRIPLHRLVLFVLHTGGSEAEMLGITCGQEVHNLASYPQAAPAPPRPVYK